MNQNLLRNTGSETIKLFGFNLTKKKNFQRLLRLLARCPDVMKVELRFCQLTPQLGDELFHVLAKLEKLYFVGKSLIR